MRRLAALAAVVALGAAGLVVATAPPPAEAHGAQVFPGSRQYFCWVDGTSAGGDIQPSNPACVDAVAASGKTPLYNWFGNLDSNGAGRTAGYIPDGRICDGGGNGPYDFEPYNAPRTDWPTTHVTAGDTYQFQHNNWAAHPGRFDVYVTKEGFDPTAPLGWDDLEKIDTVTDPPATGGPGGLNYYYWDVTLPSDRTGRHVVFTHWVRSDSNENFYSCSDVAFDGGDGEVTGLDGDVPGPTPTPTPTDDPDGCPDAAPGAPGAAMASSITQTGAHVMWGAAEAGCVTGYDVLDAATGEVLASTHGSPMVDLTGLDPGTEHSVVVRSRNDNTDTTSAPTAVLTFTTEADDGEPEPTPTPTPTEDPVGACTADYTASHWGNHPGYTGSVTVTNTSAAAVTGWVVTFDYPGGQEVDAPGWNATVAQSGTRVTATHPAWASSIAPGASVTFGFNGTATSATNHPDPTGFTLAGAACD
jgi:predicted carbohydrate-binding protein with CBM5 and CBM33 domain